MRRGRRSLDAQEVSERVDVVEQRGLLSPARRAAPAGRPRRTARCDLPASCGGGLIGRSSSRPTAAGSESWSTGVGDTVEAVVKPLPRLPRADPGVRRRDDPRRRPASADPRRGRDRRSRGHRDGRWVRGRRDGGRRPRGACGGAAAGDRGGRRRLAVRLPQVRRLEELRRQRASSAPGSRKWCSTTAVCCRSSASPTCCLNAGTSTGPASGPGAGGRPHRRLRVLGGPVGLVVGSIDDVVPSPLCRPSPRAGEASKPASSWVTGWRRCSTSRCSPSKRGSGARRDDPHRNRADVRFCSFVVGGLVLGFRSSAFWRSSAMSRSPPVPLAPHAVVGLLNLRGQIVTAVDARARLLLEPRAADDEGPSHRECQGRAGQPGGRPHGRRGRPSLPRPPRRCRRLSARRCAGCSPLPTSSPVISCSCSTRTSS